MGSPKPNKHQNGIAATEAVVGIVACIVVIVLGLLLEHKLRNADTGDQKTTSTSTNSTGSGNSSQFSILAPAIVPSKIPECSQQITFSSGGNSGPVTCTNGDLNTTEWNSLETLEPSVLALGYSATSIQVQKALCADVSANVSNPIEQTAYQIASIYYGWHFSSDPSVVIKNGTCVNHDD